MSRIYFIYISRISWWIIIYWLLQLFDLIISRQATKFHKDSFIVLIKISIMQRSHVLEVLRSLKYSIDFNDARLCTSSERIPKMRISEFR